jgi:membrane AbrB-like protein
VAGAKDKMLKWLSLKTLPGECVTLAIGAFGGLLFAFLHIPGGSMSGSVVAVALSTIYARPSPLGGPLRVLALSTMGMAIGSVVGPQTFSNMAAYPGTMALMALCVVCMTLASTLVWSWLMGWPPAMALLSSVPGSMSYIVSVSMSLGADAAKIAVAQMSRVIFLVTVLPFIVVWESGGHLGAVVQAHADPISVLAPTLAVGIAVGALFTWAGMGGGMLFGALVASGVIHYLGYGEGRAPNWVLNGGQILLGSWVGTRFIGFDWRLFGKICLGTAASVGAAMAVSVLFSMVVSKFFGVSFGTSLMAYAPGGQDAMMVLALSLGVDPIFVSAHHLARYFLINLTLPFIVGRMQRARGAATSGDAA